MQPPEAPPVAYARPFDEEDLTNLRGAGFRLPRADDDSSPPPPPHPATLSPSQVRAFFHYGCVLVENLFTPEECADISSWGDEVEAWQEHPGADAGTGYTLHHERLPSSGQKVLCRVENFVPFHSGFRALVEEKLAPLVGPLFGFNEDGSPVEGGSGGDCLGEADTSSGVTTTTTTTAVLFKEKLNYKRENGGGGYAPHYDGPSPAQSGLATHFVTAQLALDDQTVANGCLYGVLPRSACPPVVVVPPVAGGHPDVGGRAGAIPPEVAKALRWTALPTPAGSVLLFNHHFPHRSPANRGDGGSRRTGYFLFNSGEEGDQHELYYFTMAEARRAAAAAAARVGAAAAAVEVSA
jgi:hypothetical protein